MVVNELNIEVKPRDLLLEREVDEIILLCSKAYEEDYTDSFHSFVNSVHILGKIDDR